MEKLKHLFQPISIGSMEVQNRVMFPGMTIGFGVDEDRCVTPQMTGYLVERARSRPGMIVLSSTSVHLLAATEPGPRRIALWDDRVLPGLQTMVDAVHKYDVKFGIQLQQSRGQVSFSETVGPSAVVPLSPPNLPGASDPTAREMSKDEIKLSVEAYGRAAQRCVRAGFDFLEINAGFEYILSQFLTPHYNRRTDEYGGSYDNRTRFLIEAIREVRKAVGDRIPIGVKINGDDFLREGGSTLVDACKLAPTLEKEGVDYILVAGGITGGYRWFVPSMYEDQGSFAYLSSEVKQYTALPVISVIRIKNPIMANELIKEGKADLVAMGRGQIADPELVEKARQGNTTDIRPCLAECKGCIAPFFRAVDAEASCAVNPRVGREYLLEDIEDEKKANPRRVLVAGAGCAGLEAARRAAFAGHKVILCEAKGRIGGQLRLAAMMPARQEIGEIIPWYEKQLSSLGVEIRLNTAGDGDLLDQISPEVLVVATGSLPQATLRYGRGLENIRDIELVMVDDLLEERRITGDRVLIMGGDQIGLQVADYLSENGASVYVAEKSGGFAEKMAPMDRSCLLERIAEKNIKLYGEVQEVEILPTDDVWIVHSAGRERLVEIDTIIFADKRRPNTFLTELAAEKGIETHQIGDANGVAGNDQGTIMAAIAGGYEVERQI